MLSSHHLHNVRNLFQSGVGEVLTSDLTTVTVRAAAEVIIFDFHKFWAMIMKFKVLRETEENNFFLFKHNEY